MCATIVRAKAAVKIYAAAIEGQKFHNVSGVVTAIRNEAVSKASCVKLGESSPQRAGQPLQVIAILSDKGFKVEDIV